MTTCTLRVYAKDEAGASFPHIISYEFYTLKNGEWVESHASPIEIRIGKGATHLLLTENQHKIVPLPYPGYETPPEVEFAACDGGTLDLIYSQLRPTISSISWSPTGNYTTIAAGAALIESVVGGGTTQLMLVAVDPAAVVDPAIEDGEAILQIDQEDPFIVAAGDHFRFNNKEWWALNIICGPECDMITIADETAEAEKIPKIGDEIQFAANIDWHDQEMSTIKWYYAKAPGVCFSDTDIDLDWILFAVGTDMPTYVFIDSDDSSIAFIMVTATNMDFATGVLTNVCGPIFNLWDAELIGLMEIQFNSGTLYQYLNVPKEIYDGLLAAPSKGKYFWQYIRPYVIKYPYQRVR